jgi:hypothetical protein
MGHFTQIVLIFFGEFGDFCKFSYFKMNDYFNLFGQGG